MKRFLRWLRQVRCKHGFYLDDMQPRDSEGMIICPCCRCEKIFRAHYGLALPGVWLGRRIQQSDRDICDGEKHGQK